MCVAIQVAVIKVAGNSKGTAAQGEPSADRAGRVDVSHRAGAGPMKSASERRKRRATAAAAAAAAAALLPLPQRHWPTSKTTLIRLSYYSSCQVSDYGKRTYGSELARLCPRRTLIPIITFCA